MTDPRSPSVAPRVWNKRDPNVPKDAVYVGRPTKWGNKWSHLNVSTAPYPTHTREEAVEMFRSYLLSPSGEHLAQAAREELRGKDLVCWCAPLACHATVLLEIANG